MEYQKRNTAQLARIGAMMEERWSLKEDLWDNNDENEEDGDKEERSENGSGKSQKEIKKGILLSVSYQSNSFVFC